MMLPDQDALKAHDYTPRGRSKCTNCLEETDPVTLNRYDSICFNCHSTGNHGPAKWAEISRKEKEEWNARRRQS